MKSIKTSNNINKRVFIFTENQLKKLLNKVISENKRNKK